MVRILPAEHVDAGESEGDQSEDVEEEEMEYSDEEEEMEYSDEEEEMEYSDEDEDASKSGESLEGEEWAGPDEESQGLEYESGQSEDLDGSEDAEEDDNSDASYCDSDLEQEPADHDLLKCSWGNQVWNWKFCDKHIDVDQRESDGYGFKKTIVNWPETLHHADQRSEMDCLKLLFPWDFFFGQEETGSCLVWTNATLPANAEPFTVTEVLQFMGSLYARSIHPYGRAQDMWKSSGRKLIPSLDLENRFAVNRKRFELWQQHLRFCPPAAESTDEYEQIRPLIDALNELRKRTISAGTELFVAKIRAPRTRMEKYSHGNLSVPPMDFELNMLGECSNGLGLKFELSAQPTTYSHTECVLRLAEEHLDRGQIIYSNVDYASVARPRSPGTEHVLQRCNPQAPWFSHATVELQVEVEGKERRIYGHAWKNAQRTGAGVFKLISTFKTTRAENLNSEKRRRKIDPLTGRWREEIQVRGPDGMMEAYFNAAMIMQSQTLLSKDILWIPRTRTPEPLPFRVLCSVLGLIEVDAYKVYSSCQSFHRKLNHYDFTSKIAMRLMRKDL
ncbi:hypothetical protein GUITHDRAFT_103336 [Guillardia theta CCMP2712]|uniref:PiggyBac transposable element-derived protein domain-containing protein n=2 Tax=Guillardia theta TaxID=55529 RepID=L1JRD1_GUITC|nr:hypothetical protein GUITHDRAFT_103336 [Guillardia theta CCMP2712]EKX50745.1 hypothetical protein GUITHDRAFT_103336 [Guillardia theta CCMP2712]|eukprot:XP_005837725.1 hypothetical protein GUITHDRAFT_103336 [Guillardia theta CCMP2712]